MSTDFLDDQRGALSEVSVGQELGRLQCSAYALIERLGAGGE